mgnify:CR=1 FL=1
MKEIDFDLENNPFINFLSSRYTMSARVNVENLWIKSKEQDLSFFVMSLGALMNALNDIPQMRRRIIDGKVIEFESLDAVCPIMDKEETVFKEIRIEGPQRFYNILKWHDYVVDYQLNVLELHTLNFSKADFYWCFSTSKYFYINCNCMLSKIHSLYDTYCVFPCTCNNNNCISFFEINAFFPLCISLNLTTEHSSINSF